MIKDLKYSSAVTEGNFDLNAKMNNCIEALTGFFLNLLPENNANFNESVKNKIFFDERLFIRKFVNDCIDKIEQNQSVINIIKPEYKMNYNDSSTKNRKDHGCFDNDVMAFSPEK